jgi:AhpD family alkylhydroperoxidase
MEAIGKTERRHGMKIRHFAVVLLIAVVMPAVIETVARAGGQEQPAIPHSEKILASVEAKKGFRPPALLLMSGREGTLGRFMAYGKHVFEGGPLSEKESYLVALAAAAANKSPVCIRAHSESALRAGASREEVLQTVLIAGVVSGTSPLHAAYDASEMIRTLVEERNAE